MRTLIVYPSFMCPFSCTFCITKDKNSLNEYLDLNVLEEFLKQNGNKFDKIKISGGEPMFLNKGYFDETVDIIKKYNSNVWVSTYPVELNNYRDDLQYEMSYDFMARPRALNAWENLLKFPLPFDVKILVSPQILKTIHPNAIYNKLALLPNIKSVEFKEYYRTNATMWNLNNNVYDKFIKYALSSNLSIKYINLNKEKMRFLVGKASRIDENAFEKEFCLLPDGKFYIQNFDENDVSSFKEISADQIETAIINYPETYNFYSKDLQNWSIENDI